LPKAAAQTFAQPREGAIAYDKNQNAVKKRGVEWFFGYWRPRGYRAKCASLDKELAT